MVNGQCQKKSTGNRQCSQKPLINQHNNALESMYQLVWHLPVYSTMIAQNVKDPNIIGQMQTGFNHFIQTGQVWALLIGLVIGYIIRNLTSYG